MITSLCDLKETWRVMKVKHGDSHPGAINKMAVISRNELQRSDIAYAGPNGGSNIEVFAFIAGHGRIFTIKELEGAVARRKRKVAVVFHSYDRSTGHQKLLGRVVYKRRVAA